MGDPVIRFEIHGRDVESLRRFYRDAFGWKVDVVPDGSYTVVDTDSDGAGIQGGIAQSADGRPRFIFYVEVRDINAYLNRIQAAGGAVVVDRTEWPVVTTAQAMDPEGNIIGLTELREP